MQESQLANEAGGGTGIPVRPCLKPWYRLARGDGKLIFEYGQAKVVLEGRAVEKLLPVLLPLADGTRTIDEISAGIGDGIRPAVTKAFSTLAERGLLTEGPAGLPGAAAASAETAQFLTATAGEGRTVAEAGEVLERSAATVVGAGLLAEGVARGMRKAGLTSLRMLDWAAAAADLEPIQLAVVAPEPGELPMLRDWNRFALQRRLPWLQVLPFDGRTAVVGPLYVPDETCCYECFRRRRRANLRWTSSEEELLEEAPAGYPSPHPLQDLLAGCAAMVAIDWLYKRSGGEQATAWAAAMQVLHWDRGLEIDRHHVYRVPRCPECFPDDLGTASPWYR